MHNWCYCYKPQHTFLLAVPAVGRAPTLVPVAMPTQKHPESSSTFNHVLRVLCTGRFTQQPCQPQSLEASLVLLMSDEQPCCDGHQHTALADPLALA
jgi:hypothetical protein